MKKSKYQFYEDLGDDRFLHYSASSNSFIIMQKQQHDIFETAAENLPSELLDKCKKAQFLIDNDYDETNQIIKRRKEWMDSPEMYQIMVNPTLDCNLNCWYCYENRIKDSKISDDIIKGIKRNIELHYSKHTFTCLKLSFFGGEPFLCFEAIKEILDFAKEFCASKEIELIADFTTNATLIDDDIVKYLSQYRCHFQITLDGNEEQHNKIKSCKEKPFNSYRKVLEVLKLINDNIENRWLAVRVNFDNRTLATFENILKDISFLDRRFTYVIIKKVWQLKTELVDKEALLNAIQLTFDYKFTPDYYIMPKGCLCFAERRHQALVNYDGGVFKCSTLNSFDKDNSLGTFNPETGEITWDGAKTAEWYADMQPDYCKECKWFPACMGICNRQLIAHNGERICTFDAMNLSPKEYLMYLFKCQLLQRSIQWNE